MHIMHVLYCHNVMLSRGSDQYRFYLGIVKRCEKAPFTQSGYGLPSKKVKRTGNPMYGR